ncbi:ATP-binding protein [Shewanella gelidii]|uniref:histidine kinase n=1 Tax=Shewanella gelidii TaxID=1642821 RepID=A0A917JIN6_9GAMM|nr:transporter substrate-binding domain-containing protein [Shewanella gelidii]MCL1096917.1 ATP-binding protein [Shewanella gelidii]GGI71212.1 hypothetical protein GCM10009332_05590 [Shewanella gelidii]
MNLSPFKWLCVIAIIFAYPSYAEDTVTLGVHSKTAPFAWHSNDEDQGFNIELLTRISQLNDKELIVKRKSFQELVSDINNSDSDVDIAVMVSPVGIARQQLQSDPIYATHAQAYTLQGRDFIDNWDDLAGKRVAIKSGSFVDVYIRGHVQEFTRVDVDLYETGFKLLEQDKVDVVLAENFVARRLLPFFTSIHSSSDPLIFGAFVFVANQSNKELMIKINGTLRRLKLSGEYDELVNKWFGTGREKVDLISTQEKMLFAALIVTAISAFGMVYTRSISQRLEKRTVALALELKQRHEAEQKISSLSQQFQSVLDGIPHGVSLYNQELSCLWSNDNNNQLLEDEAFCHQNGKIFSLRNLVDNVLMQQKSVIQEMSYRDQYWLLQAHPIANRQVVILLEESTEQHRLRQANDEASRLASLGELSAGIAHEINNPTGIIVHSIDFFAKALVDLEPAAKNYQEDNPFWQIAGLAPNRALEELQHSSVTIEESARRISRIVSDLKRYAQPNLRSRHTAANLNEVVKVSLRLAANQIKRFQVNTHLIESEPFVIGDPQQLQQVMINLLQNASNALTSELENNQQVNGQIDVETLVSGKKAKIIIRDNGPGMDSATLQRVTEPFFTTRRASGGSGLGLSVSSRIIKEHQGQMQISSRVGEGTCITLIFKLEQTT